MADADAVEKGFTRLCLAIVLRAMTDFRDNPDDKNLQEWLLEDGFLIMQICEQPIPERVWREYVRAGCPGDYGIHSRVHI